MSAIEWPQRGRASRAGQPPTELQHKAILFVYQMGSGPVGDGSTRAEIEAEVPGITLEELNDCLTAEWLRLQWWGVIGGAPSGEADCWDCAPDGEAFLRREMMATIPEHEHQWAETVCAERFWEAWCVRQCRRCLRVEARCFMARNWGHVPHLDGLDYEHTKALAWRRRVARELNEQLQRRGAVGAMW